MKPLTAIIDEIEITNPELFTSLDKVIRSLASSSGIVTDSSSDTTEHPVDPPNPPR